MLCWDAWFLRIEWNEELQCVCTEWKDSYADGDEYRAALDRVIVLLKSKGASRLLGDGRRMRVIAAADQEWVESSWIPRSVQAGLRHSALLLPKSVVAQISVRSIMTRHQLSDSFSVDAVQAYFDDMEKAKAWLRGLPRPW